MINVSIAQYLVIKNKVKVYGKIGKLNVKLGKLEKVFKEATDV